MLEITVPAMSLFDDRTGEFHDTVEVKLQLEHSLSSIAEWESKWNKPFLTNEDKTTEETIDYIRCMTLNDDVDDYVYYALTNDLYSKIGDYINKPMTAAKFKPERKRPTETITAETIVYWMTALGLPMEPFSHWHLNRLLAQIKEIEVHQEPQKKMSKRELAERNRALNAARCAKHHTRG